MDRPVTVPPVRVEVPLVVVRLLSVPPVRFKVPEVVVLPVTVPPMISAVPLLLTFKLARVTFEANEPPVTFDKPATDPPVRVVVPLVVVKELSVPPVTVNVPAETVEPATVPPVMLEVPLLLIFRLLSATFDSSVPPVTFDKPVTFPPVSEAVPFETVREFRDPPDIFRVFAEVVAPVTDPPVMVADPD